MTEHEQLICIFRSAVTGMPLPPMGPVDEERIRKIACFHHIAATIAPVMLGEGLSAGGEGEEWWKEAKYKCIRQTYLFDAERRSVYRALAEAGVRCAPLKGVALDPLYPLYGTREFADNDILVDGGSYDVITRAMASLGYERQETAEDIHLSFFKQPMFNFELHFRLFPRDKKRLARLDRFFADVTSRLVPPAAGEEAYALRPEDQYLFLIAHAYKHYVEAGTGLRILADIFLYRTKMCPDAEAVEHGLEEMQILPFARALEGLSQKLFSADADLSFSALTKQEKKLLEEILAMGVFGTWNGYYSRKYRTFSEENDTDSRLRYYKSRVFPGMEAYKTKHPVIYRHKVLYPLFYGYRITRGIFTKPKKLRTEFRAVTKERKEKGE